MCDRECARARISWGAQLTSCSASRTTPKWRSKSRLWFCSSSGSTQTEPSSTRQSRAVCPTTITSVGPIDVTVLHPTRVCGSSSTSSLAAYQMPRCPMSNTAAASLSTASTSLPQPVDPFPNLGNTDASIVIVTASVRGSAHLRHTRTRRGAGADIMRCVSPARSAKDWGGSVSREQRAWCNSIDHHSGSPCMHHLSVPPRWPTAC
jgi:hypothetical protein